MTLAGSSSEDDDSSSVEFDSSGISKSKVLIFVVLEAPKTFFALPLTLTLPLIASSSSVAVSSDLSWSIADRREEPRIRSPQSVYELHALQSPPLGMMALVLIPESPSRKYLERQVVCETAVQDGAVQRTVAPGSYDPKSSFCIKKAIWHDAQ